VRLDDYRNLARPLSAAWDTLSMPVAKFREVAAPVDDYFRAALPAELANCSAATSAPWDDGP
jgi:hypothetical protein